MPGSSPTQTPVVLVGERGDLVAVADLDGGGQRPEHADGDAAVVRVGAEHRVRVAVATRHQQVELVVGNGSGHVASLSMAPNGIPSQLGRLRTS